MDKVFHVYFFIAIFRSSLFITLDTVFADEITDSPALQSMVMVFSNPAHASTDGGKRTKIKRQKAIVKYHPSEKKGEINIVVAKQYLVSVKGRNINKNDLVDVASAIDYKKLKKF